MEGQTEKSSPLAKGVGPSTGTGTSPVLAVTPVTTSRKLRLAREPHATLLQGNRSPPAMSAPGDAGVWA